MVMMDEDLHRIPCTGSVEVSLCYRMDGLKGVVVAIDICRSVLLLCQLRRRQDPWLRISTEWKSTEKVGEV